MDHAKAKTIIAQHAPNLIVDELNPALPDMIVLRKVEGGHPFCVNISHVDPSTLQPIEAKEATPEIPSAEATDDRPAVPYQPARPAVPGKTVLEQKEEREDTMLRLAVDAARHHLGDV